MQGAINPLMKDRQKACASKLSTAYEATPLNNSPRALDTCQIRSPKLRELGVTILWTS